MKHNIVGNSFIVLIVSLLGACGVSDFRSVDELRSYLSSEESVFSSIEEAGGYTARVTYLPTDLIIFYQLGSINCDSAQLNNLRREYSRYYYFNVSFSKGGRELLSALNGNAQYGDLMNTLSFRMDRYVTLISSKMDTIQMADFALDRTYGLNVSTDVLFVFDRKRVLDGDWVEFIIAEFGLGTGHMRFRFSQKSLFDAPQLHFNSMVEGANVIGVM